VAGVCHFLVISLQGFQMQEIKTKKQDFMEMDVKTATYSSADLCYLHLWVPELQFGDLDWLDLHIESVWW
jgi:hypothetical protein